MSEVRSMTPQEAWDLVQNNPQAVLIDVRSSMEFLFVGHPKGALHIAWIDEPDWDINPDFVTEVRKVVLGGVHDVEDRPSPPVVLICRSGVRSLEAGKLLVDKGFTHVYNVLDGFEGKLDDNHHRSTLGGWRFHGLPWEQC
jgi:rhodanese-related sulfurtransferase